MQQVTCHKCGLKQDIDSDSSDSVIKCSQCKSELIDASPTSSGLKKIWNNYYKFASIILILSGLVFLTVKCVTIYRKLTFNPHPFNAYKQSQTYIKSYGDLVPESKKIFPESYEFIVISKINSLYRIKSKIKTKLFFSGEYADIPYEVDMEYLGKGRWKYLDSRFFMENIKNKEFEW